MTADAGAPFLRLLVSVPATGGQRWARASRITPLCSFCIVITIYYLRLISLSVVLIYNHFWHWQCGRNLSIFLAKRKMRSLIRDHLLVPETIPFERLIEDESIILFRHRVVCVETNANSRTVANISVIQNPTHHPPSEPPDNIGPHEFCRRWRDSEQLQRQWTALATTT